METNGHNNGVSNDIEKAKPVHLLFVPMVQQAHAVTAIRFAKKLSSRGVTITLATIRQHADELHRIYSREALEKLSVYIEVLDDYQPPPIPTPVLQSPALRPAFQPLVEKLVANRKAGLPGPTCLLADRFLYWMTDVAKELNIPRYSYASNAAITVRLMQLVYECEEDIRRIPDGPEWFQKMCEIVRQKPGMDFIKADADVPSISLSNGWFDFYCDVGRGLSNTSAIVFNSFTALEHVTIEKMKNAYPGMKGKVVPIYPIGPLSLVEEFNNEKFVTGVEDSHSECVKWLGAQPCVSVLYICLGSQIHLFGETILRLARALENSQSRFLWVLSKGRGNFNTLDEVLPPGYMERIDGVGKIVTGWVGQLEILSNPAIGGFLSHCGWQSIIESLTCGVPIIGWPQVAEQRLNLRYIEEVVKCSFRITEKGSHELVEQHEFEKAITTFMSEKGRAVCAANAAKMNSMAAAAVTKGGSSDIAIDELVKLFSRHSFLVDPVALDV